MSKRLTAHPWPRRAFFVPTSVAFVINFSLIYKTFVVFLIGERINKQDWRRWQRESKKIIGFISTTTSYFLLHFFNVQCTTTTRNVLTRRCMGDGREHKATNFSILFWIWIKFNSRNICLHLTNWARLNKLCDKVLTIAPLRFADRNRLVCFWGKTYELLCCRRSHGEERY